MSAREWNPATSGRFAPTPDGKRQAPFVEPDATRGLGAFDDETQAWVRAKQAAYLSWLQDLPDRARIKPGRGYNTANGNSPVSLLRTKLAWLEGQGLVNVTEQTTPDGDTVFLVERVRP